MNMEVVNSSPPIVIGLDSLGYCSLLLIINIVLSTVLHLGLTERLIVAVIRCVVQLTILGELLELIFRANKVYFVIPFVYVTVLLAVNETYIRPKRTYGFHMFLNIGVAMSAPITVVMAYATFFVVRQDPWYDAQYLIPMTGMLLGNMLNGISLGLDHCLNGVDEGRRSIEFYLAAGATQWEATQVLIQDSLRVAMMPTLNGMNIIGLVSIPGMMTGQILGGSTPQQAARYQIVIMFMICANVGLGCIIAIYLTVLAVFDKNHRLLSHKVVKRKNSSGGILAKTYYHVRHLFNHYVSKRSGYQEIK